MFAFLDTAPSLNPVIRADDRPQLQTADADISYELLSRDLSGQLMAVLIRIRPGGRRIAERLPKPTDELMYVLSGQLSITLDDQTHTLGPGDSIGYKGDRCANSRQRATKKRSSSAASRRPFCNAQKGGASAQYLYDPAHQHLASFGSFASAHVSFRKEGDR